MTCETALCWTFLMLATATGGYVIVKLLILYVAWKALHIHREGK